MPSQESELCQFSNLCCPFLALIAIEYFYFLLKNVIPNKKRFLIVTFVLKEQNSTNIYVLKRIVIIYSPKIVSQGGKA